jgi:hypothetical protein
MNQLLRIAVADALGAMDPSAEEAVPALLAVCQRGTAPFLDRPAVIAALRRIDPEAAARNNVQ